MQICDNFWDKFWDNFRIRELQVKAHLMMIRDRFGDVPKISFVLHPSFLENADYDDDDYYYDDDYNDLEPLDGQGGASSGSTNLDQVILVMIAFIFLKVNNSMV